MTRPIQLVFLWVHRIQASDHTNWSYAWQFPFPAHVLHVFLLHSHRNSLKAPGNLHYQTGDNIFLPASNSDAELFADTSGRRVYSYLVFLTN